MTTTQPPREEGLLLCPFCKGQPVWEVAPVDEYPITEIHAVVCPGCGACIAESTAEEALRKWNRRQPNTPPQPSTADHSSATSQEGVGQGGAAGTAPNQGDAASGVSDTPMTDAFYFPFGTDNTAMFDRPIMESVKFSNQMERELNTTARALAEAQRDYQELIMAVARKFPDESRHQTALRYIVQAEEAATKGWETKANLKDEGEKRD